MHADGETCRGQAATIVGHSGDVVHGTDGDDVIVTDGASQTYAGAGDDTICIVGYYRPYVDAGDGDDVVDATSIDDLHDGDRVELGSGSDTFEGAGGRDDVTAGTLHAGDGVDRITTGRGHDTVTTGDPTEVNHDVVDLGGGHDRLCLQSERTDGDLDGGAALNRMWLVLTTPGDWVVDDGVGQLRLGGAPVAQWANLRVEELDGEHDVGVRYVGTDGADRVDVNEVSLRSADLGAGDDWLRLLRPGDGRRGLLQGGPGQDYLSVHDPTSVDLDLPRGLVSGYRLSEYEWYNAASPDVRVIGSQAAERVLFDGCSVLVRGAGGDDDIAWTYNGYTCGRKTGVRLFGGSGDDQLRGSPYRDRLSGGPGVDLVHGRDGVDWCRGEIRRLCELP